MFHRHVWSPSHGRIQACKKCGIERVLPCPHVYEIIKEVTVQELELPIGMEFILKCTKCGDIVTRMTKGLEEKVALSRALSNLVLRRQDR